MRNDTQGLANLDLMGMIDMIYIGGNYALLHIKNKSCETLGLIFLSFPKLKTYAPILSYQGLPFAILTLGL